MAPAPPVFAGQPRSHSDRADFNCWARQLSPQVLPEACATPLEGFAIGTYHACLRAFTLGMTQRL